LHLSISEDIVYVFHIGSIFKSRYQKSTTFSASKIRFKFSNWHAAFFIYSFLSTFFEDSTKKVLLMNFLKTSWIIILEFQWLHRNLEISYSYVWQNWGRYFISLISVMIWEDLMNSKTHYKRLLILTSLDTRKRIFLSEPLILSPEELNLSFYFIYSS